MRIHSHQHHSFYRKRGKIKKSNNMMHSWSERKMMIIWSLCLIFSLSNSMLVFASPAKHLCRPDQKDALWEFKIEFNFLRPDWMKSDTQTEKWRNNTDCCSWAGVSCDHKTGVVVELDLYHGYLNGPLRSNSSLFRLQHLQSLNLSSGNLSGILPDSIGNLNYLRELSLFNCNFFGKIPSSLGNLSYLTRLDLSINGFTGEIPDWMGNLKYLKDLSLDSCNFFGKIPSSLGNLSYLTRLDLYGNGFTGEIPDSMGNLNRLTHLNLDSNKLSGNFPPLLLNLSELTEIGLGYNQFEGMLPSNMSSLSKLEIFDISGNSFHGSIPPSLFMIPSLIELGLEENHFSGSLGIGNISSPSKLRGLSLGENNFSGQIPEHISKLVGLIYLDLSFWNTGRSTVDFSIFVHLKSLEVLYLSNLNTKSTLDLNLFSRLMSLGALDLSGNNLKISSTLHLRSPIEHLLLSSCSIAEFPKFLQTQTSLHFLDISANLIEGQVPEWLWSLPDLGYVNISQNSFSGFQGSEDVIQRRTSLFMLDVSSNSFKGTLPLLPEIMTYFLGSENGFSGELHRAICENFDLRILVLSNNNFNGSLPRCSENFRLTPSILHLHNNSFSGVFPQEYITDSLKSLDVGRNWLSGELPKSLINCTKLEFLNVEDNIINDTFPFWLGSLPNLQILVLRSNEFHGPISSRGDSLSFSKLRIFDISENLFSGVLPSDYFAGWNALSSVVDIVTTSLVRFADDYHQSVGLTNKGLSMELVGSSFTIYKTIDVSGNRFEGGIPESISLLKELIVLNMSNNAFTGQIPPSLENLTKLESFDLSQNGLSGGIPPELGKLTFLAWMNFSHNMLEGPIPQGTQFQSQNSSSFAENPGLCGAPLQETCGGKKEATKQEEDEEKEEENQIFSWIAAAIGYVPGVFCGLTIGHILISYKYEWFMRIFHFFT